MSMLINSPCKECGNRQRPKHCENSCVLWQEYYAKREKEKEITRKNKQMSFDIKTRKKL